MVKLLAGLGATGLALLTTALTYSSGSVSFEPSDTAVMDQAVSTALGNFWAGFLFVLPYLGVAIGVLLVVAVGMMLARKFRA